MTRKDYELIAFVFLDAKDAPTSFEPQLWLEGFENARELVAGRLAAFLKIDNPRFDRDRVLRACGVEG